MPLARLNPYVSFEIDGRQKIVMTSRLVRHFLPLLFKKETVKESAVIRVTRNADVYLSNLGDDSGDLRTKTSSMLSKRKREQPVRLLIYGKLTEASRALLIKKLRIKEENVFQTAVPFDLSFRNAISNQEGLRYPEHRPARQIGLKKGEYFAYIAAFGAFTEVSYATPQDQKRALGHLAYVLQGAAQLGKIEKIRTRIEYDDGVYEGDLVYGSMSNSTSVAGIVHLREEMVSLGDGMSELVLVRDPGTIDAYGELAAAVLSRSFDSRYLTILHTKHAKFTFEKPIAWTRDGEAGGEHREIELCNYHCPVQLIF